MVSFVIGVVFLFCLFAIFLKNKSLFNIQGIFVLSWGLSSFFSSLSLYGLNSLSFEMCAIIVSAMLLVTFLSIFFPKSNNRTIANVKYKKKLSSSMLLLILNVVAWVFSFPYLLKSIDIMKNIGWWYLRVVGFSASDYATTTELLIFQTLIQPLFVVNVMLTSLDFACKKKAFLGLFISVVGVALYTLLFGGRYLIFESIIVVIVTFYSQSNFSLLTFLKKNKVLTFIAIISLCILIVITFRRSGSGFLRQVYVYFCGSYAYFDQLIDDNSLSHLYLLGACTFGMVYNSICMGLTFVFNLDYRGSNHIVTSITQYTIPIGEGITYNSLGTMMTSFVSDYGLVFWPIGLLIFFSFALFVQKVSIKTRSPFVIMLYIFLVYSCVNMVFGYAFASPSTFVLLFYLFIFTRRKVLKYNRETRSNFYNNSIQSRRLYREND